MMLHLTSCASDLAIAVDLLRAGELVPIDARAV